MLPGNVLGYPSPPAAVAAQAAAAAVAEQTSAPRSDSSADGNFVLARGGPGDKMAAGYQHNTFAGVVDKVAQFGYRLNNPAGDGDVSGWWQYEMDYVGTGDRMSEIMAIWFGPTGVHRRPFFVAIDHGSSQAPSSGKAEGYTRFGINAHEFFVGGNPSGMGFPNGFSVLNPLGQVDVTLAPTLVNSDARIRATHSNQGTWIGLTAGSGGTFGDGDQIHSLDMVGASGDLKTFKFRRSSNSGTSFTTEVQFHYSGRVVFGAQADDGVHKYQFGSGAVFAGLNTATTYFKSAGFNSDLAGSDITIGRNGNDPCIWTKGHYGVSGKQSLWFDNNSTYINASDTNGGVFFQCLQGTWAGVKSGVFFIHTNPAEVTNGSGQKSLFLGKALSNPTVANIAGGFLFVDASTGALKYMGPAGTTTQLAAS